MLWLAWKLKWVLVWDSLVRLWTRSCRIRTSLIDQQIFVGWRSWFIPSPPLLFLTLHQHWCYQEVLTLSEGTFECYQQDSAVASKRLMFSHSYHWTQSAMPYYFLAFRTGKNKTRSVCTCHYGCDSVYWQRLVSKRKDPQQHFSANLNFYDTVIV